MYIPTIFEGDKFQGIKLIKDNSFGIMTVQSAQGLKSVHIPFIVKENGDRLVLQAHIAKANDMSTELYDREVLVHFSGPSSYVSPNWYREITHFPTWVYSSVHAYGTLRKLSDNELDDQVLELIKTNEERVNPDSPWQLETMPDDLIKRMKEMIVGIEMSVDRVETCLKLNQHKNESDIELLAAQIERNSSNMAQQLAEYMKQSKNETDDAVVEQYLNKYAINDK